LEKQLHVLFNNAGVMTPPDGSKTSDGYELQWGTNGKSSLHFFLLLKIDMRKKRIYMSLMLLMAKICL